MPNSYAYILTEKENVEGRIEIMEQFRIPPDNVFVDQRNSRRERAGFELLLKHVQPHDIVYVRDFDDLGYDIEEMRDSFYMLTKRKRAECVMVEYPLMDTRFRKEVNGTFVTDLVMCLLEYMSEKKWEQSVLQREGIERARKEGVQFGRPEVKLPDKFETAYEAYRRKDITGIDAAKFCGMAVSTFYRKANEHEREIVESSA